jgi:hypothetical protein
MRKTTFFLFLFIAIGSFAQQKRLILQNINVVDVEKGKVLSGQTVVITGDRITSINKASTFKPTPADSVADGTGQYLTPGLWDMHTHVWAPDYFFSLFIANGITGIRGMFESPFFINAWRQKGNTAGELTPRGFYAGPIVDGPKPIWTGSAAAGDTARARVIVDSLKNQLKVDFIKVYSLLERDVYYTIMDQAKKQGMVVAGHVPNKISLLEAARAGQKCMEHMDGFKEIASDSSEYYYQMIRGLVKDSTYNAPSAKTEMLLRTFSEKKLAAAVKELKKLGTWFCPTMTVNRGIAIMNDSSFANDPRAVYLPLMIKNMWDPTKDFRFKNADALYFDRLRRIYELDKRVIRALNDAGIPLLAGTDIPNPYCYPGFSIHEELQIFTECGLTPAQALRTATLNPALYFGIEKDHGTVATGKLADLLLLKSNPLENIGNTRNIGAVIIKGRFIGPAGMDALLQKARKLAGN